MLLHLFLICVNNFSTNLVFHLILNNIAFSKYTLIWISLQGLIKLCLSVYLSIKSEYVGGNKDYKIKHEAVIQV